MPNGRVRPTASGNRTANWSTCPVASAASQALPSMFLENRYTGVHQRVASSTNAAGSPRLALCTRTSSTSASFDMGPPQWTRRSKELEMDRHPRNSASEGQRHSLPLDVVEPERPVQGKGRRLCGNHFELDGPDALPARLVAEASEERARDASPAFLRDHVQLLDPQREAAALDRDHPVGEEDPNGPPLALGEPQPGR